MSAKSLLIQEEMINHVLCILADAMKHFLSLLNHWLAGSVTLIGFWGVYNFARSLKVKVYANLMQSWWGFLRRKVVARRLESYKKF